MVATSAVVKFWHVLKSKCWTWLRPILRKRLFTVIRRAVSNVSKKPLNKHFPRMSSESWLISKGLVERRFSLACFSCWAEFNGKKSLNPNPRGDIARYVSSSYSLCTLKVSQLLPSEERRQVLRILDGGHSKLEVDSWLLWKEDRQAASMVNVSKEWVKVINRNVSHSILETCTTEVAGSAFAKCNWKVEQAHGQDEIRLRLIFSRKSELPDLPREVGFSILAFFWVGHSDETF